MTLKQKIEMISFKATPETKLFISFSVHRYLMNELSYWRPKPEEVLAKFNGVEVVVCEHFDPKKITDSFVIIVIDDKIQEELIFDVTKGIFLESDFSRKGMRILENKKRLIIFNDKITEQGFNSLKAWLDGNNILSLGGNISREEFNEYLEESSKIKTEKTQ